MSMYLLEFHFQNVIQNKREYYPIDIPWKRERVKKGDGEFEFRKLLKKRDDEGEENRYMVWRGEIDTYFR